MLKIFLSHSSHYKPLLRELRSKLPEHINSWIDEDKLLLGDDLTTTFEQAISEDVDFLVLFIDERANNSAWIKREVEWALARERTLGRTFLLPVILDKRAWETFEPADLKKRKYLLCSDFTEANISFLAQELSGQLFAWLSRDIEKVKSDKKESEERPDVLNDADKFLRSIASEIRTIVHPYREDNPLPVGDLLERMRSLDTVASLTQDQFVDLLTRMQRESLLAGLCFDGEEIYVEEEYYAWKVGAFSGAKEKIARAACRLIKSNYIVALDAGSTTDLIAKKLSRSITLGRIKNLTVVTNSLPAASELVSAACQLGMEDDDLTLRIFIAGGRVRPNTLAVVGTTQDAGSEISNIIEAVGAPDIAIIGTNGVCYDGFTTRTLLEAQTKRALLAHARLKLVATDPSKFGLQQEHIFALPSEAEILTTREGFEQVIDDFERQMQGRIKRLRYA